LYSDLDSSQTEIRKKRPRTAFTANQIKTLENEFERNKYLSVSKRMQMSKSLGLSETQVSYISLTHIKRYKTLNNLFKSTFKNIYIFLKYEQNFSFKA
jgi:BarH-like protein